MHSAIKYGPTAQTLLTGILALSLALFCCDEAVAQSAGGVQSNKAAIALTATVPAQLSLSLSDIVLDANVPDPAQSTAVASVSVTSSWVLNSESSNVELVGFFDSPQAAMSDAAGHVLPASHLLGGIAGGELGSFSESARVGTANASRTFFHQAISTANLTSSRTDTLNVQLAPINDLGAPAGEYTGVLHLRLVAY